MQEGLASGGGYGGGKADKDWFVDEVIIGRTLFLVGN